MDRAVAFAAMILTSPVLVIRAVRTFLRTGRVLTPVEAVGRGGKTFRLWHFADEDRGSALLHLAAIAGGHMRFVGPRPVLVGQLSELPADQRWRLDGYPGLFSAHRLQQHTGIAYDEEHDLDRALLADQSLSNPANVGLIARSMVAGILGGTSSDHAPDHIDMLDISIANTTMQDALDRVFAQANSGPTAPGRGQLVCFVNPGCLNTAVRDAAYRTVLHDADLVLPDGIGIKIATRLHRVGLRENVNGTDMFPRLCERAAQERTPIFLLGAREGVAAAAATAMMALYPNLVIAGTHHGYLDETEKEDEVITRINSSGARILLVAMGVPQQELWLDRVRDRLSPPVLMGVGGLFDFYSGRIRRAPLWLREIGMEWAWRLAQEPRRMWRRYIIGNPVFLYRVWRQKTTAGRDRTAA